MPIAPACPGCSKPVLASRNGELPPWCPLCGVSLKAAPAEQLAVAPTPMGPAGLLTSVDAAPTESFFHACIPAFWESDHHLYRIYVHEGELWVFTLGVGQVSLGEIMPRTRSMVMGYGGMGAAIMRMQEAQRIHLAERIEALDTADPATLRQFAASGDRAFIVAPDDVEWMTLKGSSLWTRLVHNVEHEAVWKFARRGRGQWSFALPGIRDARRAAEWLPRVFGNSVKVALNWGSSARGEKP